MGIGGHLNSYMRIILVLVYLCPGIAGAQVSSYPSIRIAGTFNGWNTGSHRMDLIGDNTWQRDIVITDPYFEFKFTTDGFADNWGVDSQLRITIPQSKVGHYYGDNIRITNTTSSTLIRFNFNDRTLRYSVTTPELESEPEITVEPDEASEHVEMTLEPPAAGDTPKDTTERDLTNNLPPRIVTARDRFGYLLNEAVIKKESTIEELNAHYLSRLSDLERTMRTRGDLDGLTATRREIERFRREGRLADIDLTTAPQELRALQNAYRDASTTGTFLQTAQEILQLTDRYRNGLDQSKREMIRQDNILAAKAIRAEMQRVQDHPERAWALSIVKPVEPVPVSQKDDMQPVRPAAVWGDRVYKLGQEPALDASEVLLRHTQHSRAVAHRARLQLYIREDVATKSGYGTSHTYADYSHFPRIVFRPSQQELLNAATVVFQYYAHPIGVRSAYKLVRTEHIPLPVIRNGQAAVVDGAGVQYDRYEFRPRRGNISGQGAVHFGYIVSVYCGNGLLVAQGTDQLTLVNEAPQRIPAPLNDEPGTILRKRRFDPL